MFKDLLLHLDAYPDATPPGAIDEAVAFAAAVGGKLTAMAVQVQIPLESNRLADFFVGLSGLIREEEDRSLQACRRGLGYFEERARAAGVFADTIMVKTDLFGMPDAVARRARTRDLCIVPIASELDGQDEVAQGALFDSGRPVLVLGPAAGRFGKGLDTITVAWDDSPSAASAVGAALPLLKAAKAVRVLTIVGEKPSAAAGASADLLRHLKAHGVAAVPDEVDSQGRSIGQSLEAYLEARAPDLLVMGAYGHSRIREFILGGATQHVLSRPGAVPILLSR